MLFFINKTVDKNQYKFDYFKFRLVSEAKKIKKICPSGNLQSEQHWLQRLFSGYRLR
jgi:hypothetical protein